MAMFILVVLFSFSFRKQKNMSSYFFCFPSPHLTSPHGVDTDTMFVFFFIFEHNWYKSLCPCYCCLSIIFFLFPRSTSPLVFFLFFCFVLCNTSPNTATVQTTLFLICAFRRHFKPHWIIVIVVFSYFGPGRTGCSCLPPFIRKTFSFSLYISDTFFLYRIKLYSISSFSCTRVYRTCVLFQTGGVKRRKYIPGGRGNKNKVPVVICRHHSPPVSTKAKKVQ